MLKRVLLIATIFLLQVCICTAQSQGVSPKFRLLTYGLPNFMRQNAEEVVSNKWGIEFYPVAGCDVSKELEDSVEQYNKTVKLLIAKKYGQQWRKRFDKELDEEFARQQKIIALVESVDFVKRKKEEMEANDEMFFNLLVPISNTKKYDVQIRGWEKYNGEETFFRFYHFEVDYKTNKVSLISDKKKKERDKRFTEE